MAGKETARQHRALAQDQYKRGQYLQAMQSADKALALGFLDISVYDIKAAALNKLVEPEDGPWRDLGLDTIKIMCQKWPKNWRPYYRKAEHLRSRGSYSHALTAIAHSLDYSDDGSRDLILRKQTEIQGLREISQIEKERRISKANREDKRSLIRNQRIEAKKTQDFTHLLSPDILDLVVDHLIIENPSIACRIGAVRRSWRSWMLARPGAWQNLELGGKRPVEKAKTFAERGCGIVVSLRLSESFPSKLDASLAEVLDGHVAKLKKITYTRHPHVLIQQLSGQFKSIEELVQIPQHSPKFRQNTQTLVDQPNTELDRGLNTKNSSLKSVTLIDEHITLSSDSAVSRKIRSFKMCGGELKSAEASLVQLVNCTPDLVHLALENVSHSSTGLPLGQIGATLDHLEKFSVSSTPNEAPDSSNVIRDFFDKVSTPNLLHLSVWRYTQDLPSLFLSPGLSPCLSRLQSLDIGHATVEEAALLNHLKHMTQLRFLNISCTALGDTFLGAITLEGRGKDLLPNLVALSMAALDVTSLALRDFAISRLPKSAKTYLTQQTQREVKRSSAFRPSCSTSNPSSQIPTAPASSAVMHPNTRSIQESPKSPKRYLKWLCLDHCETIDHQLVEYLRTKILFVSAGKVRNEERIRGLGRYQWDLNYYDSCLADDPKERCKLVAIPGTRDGYEIHHTCGKYDHHDVEPMEERENIWESQWNPSSSQDGEIGESPIADKGKGREMREIQDDTGSQGLKRSSDSLAESGSRIKKAKGKGKITVGADGLLSGF